MSDTMHDVEAKAYNALPYELQRLCLQVHDGALVYPSELLDLFLKHRMQQPTMKQAIRLTVDDITGIIDDNRARRSME